MDEQEKQKIEVMMKDYELLKTYSTISSPGIRYNIISFALATIGIVISGTMLALSSGNISPMVTKMIIFLLILFAPFFCISILLIWLGEEQRMLRIGRFCQSLESKINAEFGGENILNWETFKRKRSERIILPEFFVIALFLGISLGSSIMGLSLAKSIFGPYFPSFNYCVISIAFLFVLYLLIHIVITIAILLFIIRNFMHEKPI